MTDKLVANTFTNLVMSVTLDTFDLRHEELVFALADQSVETGNCAIEVL